MDFRSPFRRRSFALLLLTCIGCGGESEAQPASTSGQEASSASAAPSVLRPALGSAWVIFGPDTVVAEVARTPDERATGLMYRESVPDGTGMLFVFPDVAPRSFWMRNTYVDLDIAYMGADFRIVSIRQMQALDSISVPSGAAAQYALEVRQGWFEERGIEVGTQPEVVFGG